MATQALKDREHGKIIEKIIRENDENNESIKNNVSALALKSEFSYEEVLCILESFVKWGDLIKHDFYYYFN